MDWLDRMNRAMDYIESNLAGEISYDRAAQIACCSTYHFQRMFSFITEVPLSEYIRRRRLTLAAFELQTSEIKVIDAALKYGYESPEAFSRAFKNLHEIMPTSARSMGVTLKAYPRMTFSISIKGDVEMNYRIEQKESFELCGLSAEIKGKMMPPKFMRQNHRSGQLRQMYGDLGIECLPEDTPHTPNEPKSLIFALYDFKEGGTFSYMIGHNMPKGGAPSCYETLSVPAATWVVFSSPKDPEADPAVQCKRAWSRVSEWFATSDYEHACGPELEKGFNLGNSEFHYEVWIPIKKKAG
ncbi:MAG: AraC family transcriptional regulator [Oscillospiraceae bacterium]|nr:AraC family transcriptional regulator [Oscillospiraceae bacterium]